MLQSRNLDDQRFEDIVEHAVGRIPQLCPRFLQGLGQGPHSFQHSLLTMLLGPCLLTMSLGPCLLLWNLGLRKWCSP